MKDSGVEWIGKIPDEWKVCKLKKLITFINGYPFDSSVMGDEGNCSVVRIGDLQNNGVAYDTALKVEYHDGLSKYLIRNDDILIAMSGATVGKFAIVNNITESACVNQRVGIIRSNISGYLKYVLASSGFSSYITLLSEGTAQPNISTTNINNFSICIPTPAETQIIIAYLDTKCTEIDKVVEKTRATIEEYKKLKQAIITEAVTKGVRGPRPMKPSGVEWIGDIPEEWLSHKLKYVSSIKSGDYVDAQELRADGMYPVYGGGEQISSYHSYNVNEETIIIGRVGARCGCVTLTNEKCWATDNALILTSRMYTRFAYYLLIGANLNTLNTSNAQPLITGTKIMNLVIPNPCKDEQQEISAYLDAKCAEIDRIIEKKEQLIEELGSYKKSLIYEYVTGKKEVTQK